MKNYTITKGQILEIHDRTSVHNQEQLEKWFPDAFKTELEVGKWYKRPHNSALFCVTEVLLNLENHYGIYGFDNIGNWMKDNSKTFWDKDVEATPEEVEAALINEAKKRGYKGGIKLSPLESCSNAIDTEKEDVYSYIPKVSHYVGNRLQLNGTGIYQDGKWAEILPQEKTVVPMEKALKIIAKKMKVSPENIEIKN